jgi:hypothetical protein
MDSTNRTCTRCGTLVEWKPGERPGGCPTCINEWEHRKDPRRMTVEERLTEFDSWGPILEIPFDMLQQRMQELVGRPIWTHEFASPDFLRKEIETGELANFGDVLDKLPKNKPVVVLQTGGDEHAAQ